VPVSTSGLRAWRLRALLALSFTAAAIAAEPVAPPGVAGNTQLYVTPPVLSLADVSALDAVTENLRRFVWYMYSEPRVQGLTDSRGRTCAQDLDEWLMTADEQARLAALRARAQSASEHGETGALHAALIEAQSLVQEELYRYYLIASYWWLQGNVVDHQERVKRLESLLPPGEATDVDASLARANAAAAQMLTIALTANPGRQAQVDALQSAQLAVFDAYNTVRGQLAHKVGEAASHAAPLTRSPESPCEGALAHTSGQPVPRLAADNPPSGSVYPQEMRRKYFEGKVLVEAQVEPSGCARQASVLESSGVEELDEAALHWALQIRYQPAEREHQAIIAPLRFRVKFTLH
jgi:TonB family protein